MPWKCINYWYSPRKHLYTIWNSVLGLKSQNLWTRKRGKATAYSTLPQYLLLILGSPSSQPTHMHHTQLLAPIFNSAIRVSGEIYQSISMSSQNHYVFHVAKNQLLKMYFFPIFPPPSGFACILGDRVLRQCQRCSIRRCAAYELQDGAERNETRREAQATGKIRTEDVGTYLAQSFGYRLGCPRSRPCPGTSKLVSAPSLSSFSSVVSGAAVDNPQGRTGQEIGASNAGLRPGGINWGRPG